MDNYCRTFAEENKLVEDLGTELLIASIPEDIRTKINLKTRFLSMDKKRKYLPQTESIKVQLSRIGINIDIERIITPFSFYGPPEGFFLATRYQVKKLNTKFLKAIDVIVHTENLLPIYWEEHQKRMGLPFKLLQAWPQHQATSVQDRVYITQEELPIFIDPEGEKRPKPHPYLKK